MEKYIKLEDIKEIMKLYSKGPLSMENHLDMFDKINSIDTEHNLYKVYIDGQEHYCIGLSIADVLDGYEDQSSVTKVEYVDICYISPWIFNGLK